MIRQENAMSDCDIHMALALIEYLKGKGVRFSPDGNVIPDREWFLDTEPCEILPFYHRGACADPSRTAICFNEPDKSLYVRISKVFAEIEEYRRFLGVMPMDLSVSRFMPIEVQRFNLLLNDLFLAVLGVNGIKFAAPTRYGSLQTVSHFRRYGEASIWSVGCVGTRNNGKESRRYEEYTRRAFILSTGCPKRILAYGKMHREERSDWESLGASVREYVDYNERSRRGGLNHVR